MVPTPDIPVLALVGRPNVGKSTLFNRLVGTRDALVAAEPGLTRDRRESEARWERYCFRVVDTGGLAFDPGAPFSAAVREQVEAGVRGADAIWLVTDGVDGLNPYDAELFRWLDKAGKPVWVMVNKADNAERAQGAAEFYRLGTERVRAISALHGIGISDALAAVAEVVPIEGDLPAAPRGEGGPIRVAFLGRPNVGKSSLLNRIMGEGRMIVSEVAGTTREAVEIPFSVAGVDYLLVDTAGIRRRSRTKEHLEKIGVLSSLGALRRTEVAVIVMDAAEPISEQDARIAGYAVDQRRGVVVALNKWDRIGKNLRTVDKVEEEVATKLRFLEFAPQVRTSATDGSGVERLFQEIRAVHGNFHRRVQTADLNRVVQMSVLRRPPPAKGRVPTKVFYGSQIRDRPPLFSLVTNHPKDIRDSYTRYMENQFRFHFGLKGTPLGIQWKGRRETTVPRRAGSGRGRKAGAS